MTLKIQASSPKSRMDLRKIIELFERTAGLARHSLFSRFASDPDYRELAERRRADAGAG